MATLEKIRSKSVLLVVIIAVALLAFILGDAITNGRNLFGNNTTVAKVGKDKIEIQEYQQKQQEISNQRDLARRQNPQQYSDYDPQVLSEEAIEQLVSEKLISNAVEALGIQSSPEMLRFIMIENPQPTPEMQQIMSGLMQSGINVQSPGDAYQVIFQPQKFGLSERQVDSFQRAWVAMEQKYAQQLGMFIYMNLLGSTYKANDLDIKAMKRDYEASANLKVAKKPYGEPDVKKYPATDEEIKKAYENQKERYAVPELTKEISFIAVNVPASPKDIAESGALAEVVVAELKGNGVTKDTRGQGVDVQRHELRMSDVTNPALKNFLSNAKGDSTVSLINNNPGGFLAAKFINRGFAVDSIQISTIYVQGGKTLIEQVLAYANSGENLDSINTKFGADSVAYMAPQWQAVYNAQGSLVQNFGFTENVYDSLVSSNGKYLVLDEQEGAAVLGTVAKKSSPKEIVEYETAEYVLQPSETTLAEARSNLQKFVDKNNTATKFVENAQKAGYFPQDLAITPSTPAVPRGGNQYYPESRSLARWVVMDSKVGEVSKIYQSKDAVHPTLYVAAVLDSYEDYIPWNNAKLKEALKAQVSHEKEGKALAKEYASKGSIDAAAQAMGTQVVDVESLQSNKRDMTVTDSKVKGRILGSKPSAKMQVIPGDDGVYVVLINSVTNEPNQMSDEQFANMFVQSYMGDQITTLRGKKKIQNNVFKFETGE